MEGDDFDVAVHTSETAVSLFDVVLPDASEPITTAQKVLDRCAQHHPAAPADPNRISELAKPKARPSVRSKSVAGGVQPPVANALAAVQRRLDPLSERPTTSDTDVMISMLQSVTSCVRAVERNVAELDQFVAQDGVVADTSQAEGDTPPIQVVKMRL